MIGMILLLMRIFRLGIVVTLLSEPVLFSFTSASAILIGASQLEHLFGISIPSGTLPQQLYWVFAEIKEINYQAFLLGIFGVALMMGIQKFNQKYRTGKIPLPAALILVVFATLFQYLAQLNVAIVGPVPSGFPGIWTPVITSARFSSLLPGAVTIALLAYVLTISVAKQIARKLKYAVDPNQELLALAICNLFGALTYAYPSCCSLSRSTIAMTTNPGTQMHGLITTLVIVIVIESLTFTLENLPAAILASVIFVAVEGMIDFKEPRRLWTVSKQDFIVWQITFWSTLIFDVVPGIAIAVTVSLLILLRENMRPRTAVLGRLGETDFFWDSTTDVYSLKTIADIRIVRFYCSIHFANKDYFEHLMLCCMGVEKNPLIPYEESIRAIIVDASAMSSIDSSGIGMLVEIATEIESRNVLFLMACLEGPVLDVFQTNKDLLTKIPPSHRFISVKGALDYAERQGPGGTLAYTFSQLISPPPLTDAKQVIDVKERKNLNSDQHTTQMVGTSNDQDRTY